MEYPLRIDKRKASREYVIGIINETTFNPAGNKAIGKTAPPSSELNEPKISPNGSPCLKIIVPAAEKMPKLINTIMESMNVIMNEGIFVFEKSKPKNKAETKNMKIKTVPLWINLNNADINIIDFVSVWELNKASKQPAI